jgi:D-tyrosyl-tRNA(Tyr) deacylase
MRAVVQRVISSSVSVDNKKIAEIKQGLNVLLAVGRDDNEQSAKYLAKKIMQLRIFPDSEGKMNLSIQDIGGEVLVISQFTLYGDCKKGNRPSYTMSAPADKANELYDYFIEYLRHNYSNKIQTGEFQADMKVGILNDGPVTLVIESRNSANG